MSTNPIAKLRSHGLRRSLLVAEAAAILAFVSLALRLLPFRRAIRLGAVAVHKSAAKTGPVDDCIWAIEAAAGRLPWRIVCIQKGIAAQWMLRRRRVDAVLHYGVSTKREQKLEAHVWVSVDGQAVVGGAEAGDFAPVAVFP